MSSAAEFRAAANCCPAAADAACSAAVLQYWDAGNQEMVRCCDGNRRYQIPDDDYPVLGTNTNFHFKKILKLHSCKICTIADHHDMKFQDKDYYCIFSTETEVLLLL